jgi:hypothetical protein
MQTKTAFQGTIVVALLGVLTFALSFARAAVWPQFRGPTGGGISSETDLPLTWGVPMNENVLWTAELAGDGIPSPIVRKNRLFVLNCSRKSEDQKLGRKYPQQCLACYDTGKGELL